MKKKQKETDEVILRLQAERDMLEDKLISEKKLLERKIDAVKAKRDYITFLSSGQMSSIVEAIICLLPELPSEEVMLIKMLNSGDSIQHIADSQFVPASQLRRTVERIAIRISKLSTYYEYLDRENKRLFDRCEQQNAHISKLRHDLTRLKRNGFNGDEESILKSKLDHISLESLGLSSRPIYALTRNGIITVSDLLALPTQSLLGFRNLGKTSLNEINTVIGELSARVGTALFLGMFAHNNND